MLKKDQDHNAPRSSGVLLYPSYQNVYMKPDMNWSRKSAVRYLKPALIGMAVGVLLFFVFSPTRFLSSVKALKPTVVHSRRVQLDSPTQFEQAVFKAIEQYRHLEQQKVLDRTYAVWQDAPKQIPTGEHLYGNSSARFTLVEFSDFECPFCKSFHQTLKRLVDTSEGLINWQFHSIPLHNPASLQEAEAAECVAAVKGNRGFWVFANQVFTHTRSNGGGVPDMEALLNTAGVDVTIHQACLRTEKAKEVINKAMQEAQSLGVDGTPATLVIDHLSGKKQVVSGAQPPQAIAAVIQKMMQEATHQDIQASAVSQQKSAPLN